MQWGYSFRPACLAGAVLANGVIARPAHALSGADTIFAPSCHFASHLERSFAAAAHLLTPGMSGAEAAGTTFGAPPNLFFLITTVLAIGLCLVIVRRLWVVNEERDAAWNKVASLEALSERDPLTGLMNRRAAADRFADLHRQGFDTFALIDLDQFKTVNDRFGHQKGDEALIACANALRSCGECDHVAVRLGGEEFVVLLRGPHAFDRAEALRQSIPRRVASEVEGLDRPVTASMGLIELPRDSHELTSFETLYSRADQLLYNAKASGRNRTCFERLTVFNDAPPQRNRAQSTA